MVKLVREYDQAAAAGLAARRRLCCASRPAGGAAVLGSGHTALRRAVTRNTRGALPGLGKMPGRGPGIFHFR